MGSRKTYYTLIIMSLASLSVVISLAVFRNLTAVFLLYHAGMCTALPVIDFLIIRKLSLSEAVSYLGFSKTNVKNSVLAGLLHGFVFLSLTIGGFFMLEDVFSASDIAVSLEQWGPPGK